VGSCRSGRARPGQVALFGGPANGRSKGGPCLGEASATDLAGVLVETPVISDEAEREGLLGGGAGHTPMIPTPGDNNALSSALRAPTVSPDRYAHR
jgi:hypothetical protein